MESPTTTLPTTVTLFKDPKGPAVSRISGSLAMYHANELFHTTLSTKIAISPSSSASLRVLIPSKLRSCPAVQSLFAEGSSGIILYPQTCLACAAFLADMRLMSNLSMLGIESLNSSSSSSSAVSDPGVIQPIHLLKDNSQPSINKSLISSSRAFNNTSGAVSFTLSPMENFNDDIKNKKFVSLYSGKSDATEAILHATLLRTKGIQDNVVHPTAVLTPVYFQDPPSWITDSIDTVSIPHELNDLFYHLPQRASDNLAITVCIPFYSENGYALRRGLEGLVLQRSDLRRYYAYCHPELVERQGGLPELHVMAIADGWRKNGGSCGPFILSDSMFSEIASIFGPSLDVDELVRLLEMPEEVDDADIESNANVPTAPKGVLIQFALNKTLSPVWIDVTAGQSMECRAESISGAAALAMAAAIKKHNDTGDDASQALAYSADKSSGDKEQPIYFSLYIKRHNSKKHHSHRLFLEAFSPINRIRSNGNAKYMFLTDCGTLYSPFMLAELYHHMQMNPFCGASTGHQRIMENQDQADPRVLAAEPFTESFLRSVQSYDFEAGLCTFNAMHALVGFLPVVPGPCAFFRASAITHERICILRDIVTSEPHLDGLIQGNLKIAEDRILSFILLMTLPKSIASTTQQESSSLSPAQSRLHDASSAWQTDWVLSTSFYFESEETLSELVQQRRRWLNGTQAGNIWLLCNSMLWRGLSQGDIMAWKVLILSSFQMLVFFITALLPGFLIVVGTISISGLTLMISIVFPGVLGDESDSTKKAQAAFLTIAFSTLFAHAAFARFGSRNYEPLIWLVRSIVNAVVTTMIVLTTVALMAVIAIAPHQLENKTGERSFRYIVATLLTCVFVSTSPFFLTYMHSRTSFYRSISTFPAYLLFSQTILSDFNVFSVAQMDNVQWGTKSNLGGGTGKSQDVITDAAQARLIAAGRSRALAAFGSSENGQVESEASALVSQLRSKMREQRQHLKKSAIAREKTWTTTNFLSIFQMVVTVALVATNIALEKSISGYLLYVGVVIGLISVVISSLSFIFFVKRAICGPAAGNFCERSFAVINALGWLALLGCVSTVLLSDVTSRIFNWKDAGVLFTIIYAGLIVCAFIRSFTSPIVSLAARATDPFDKNRSFPTPTGSTSTYLPISHLSAANDFADAFLDKAEKSISVALAANVAVRLNMLVDVISSIQDDLEGILSLDLGKTSKMTGKFTSLPPRDYARVSNKLSLAVVELTNSAMRKAVGLQTAEEAATAQTLLLINLVKGVFADETFRDRVQKRIVVKDAIKDAIVTLETEVMDAGVSLDIVQTLCTAMTEEVNKIINRWEVEPDNNSLDHVNNIQIEIENVDGIK